MDERWNKSGAEEVMNEGANKILIRRYYEELWNGWNFALADELLSEEICFRGSLGAEMRGRAAAVVAALVRGKAGEVYNIVDDEPVPATAMVRQLVDAIHAPKPWPMPMWFVRFAAPFAAAAWLSTTLRVSNEKAKRELAWQPRFRTIAEGLRDFVRPNHDQTP